MSFTLILVIMTAFISYQAINNPAMKQQLSFYPYAVKKNGELFRFLSHGLVHADWNHLIINMIVLYQFGEVAESLFGLLFGRTFGGLAFLLFYFSAIIFASIPDYFKHQDNQYYHAVGASGATSALVFIYILLDPWNWFLFPPLPAILLGIGYLMYSSYMAKRGGDNIGHNAHLYGALYGLVFGLSSFALFQPELLYNFVGILLEGPRLPTF